ncbi:hypothetical protein [Deinococcus marmoris]|nr:hypothetical protein [Deinococcus marmoris]
MTALKALIENDLIIGGSYPAAVERLRRLCVRTGVAYRGHHALGRG